MPHPLDPVAKEEIREVAAILLRVDKVSFWLEPAGFFDRNPSLDVPPT